MPDGFDPHVERERIWTRVDWDVGCRQRIPMALAILDQSLMDEDKYLRVSTAKWMVEQTFGKARQQVEHMVSTETKRVHQITLPSNGRADQIEGPVIDA
jgi:hypothetical protein